MAKTPAKRKWPGVLNNAKAFAFVLLITAGTFLVWLTDPLVLQGMRLAQFDQFQRWHLRTYTPAPVRVVDIDETSLKAYGQWPWPRTRVAELVTRLNDAGAVVIAFDVLMSEPDRTSPKAMAQVWRNPSVSPLLQGLPDHDQFLGKALLDRSVVLGSSLANSGEAQKTPFEMKSPPFKVVRKGSGDPMLWLNRYDDAVLPLAVLTAQAAGIGAMNFTPDPDGVVRRVPLLFQLGNQIVPTLSAEALRVGSGVRNYLLRTESDGVQEVRIAGLTLPTNPQAELWLHYTEDVPERYIPASQILTGDFKPELIKDNIVLIGSSASGLLDLRFNPLGQVMPGVQAHALALEQSLIGHFLKRPSWANASEALTMVLGTLLVGLVALSVSAKWAAAFTVVVLGSLFGLAWYGFVEHLLLIDVMGAALAMAISYVLASGVHHFLSERQQRWVREAFSRYVSPNRVEHLVANPEMLELGGHRQVCSFVFTDLAGFTSLMEKNDPGTAVTLLNDYLDGMLTILFKYEGTLDRIIGDAVVGMFSAPVIQQDHQQRAFNCAMEMDAFASGYSTKLKAQGIAWGKTRIGLHCGEVIVGNFGGKNMFDYRALGDPINTSARLESVNKHLGTKVCVSEALLEGCPGAAVRYVGRLVLKGKSVPLAVYEPLASIDAQACASQQDYEAAMAQLRPETAQGDHPAKDALARFEQMAQAHPADPLVNLHLQRLREGADSDLIVMTEK